MLDNKLCHMKLILNGFHLNGNIIGVRPQTQKLEGVIGLTESYLIFVYTISSIPVVFLDFRSSASSSHPVARQRKLQKS